MKSSLIVLSLLSVSAAAWADGVLKPMHGGVMAEAPSGLRIELAADPAGLAVYLRSHSDKLLPARASAAMWCCWAHKASKPLR